MEHTEIKRLIASYHEGMLDDSQKEQVEEHIRTCPECRQEFEEMKKFEEVMGKMAFKKPSKETWEGYWSAVYNRLERGIGWISISIGAMIAIIVGLVFLHRRVKGATRSIGIPCLTCGISIYVSTVVIKYLAGMQMIQIGLPAQLQAWLPQILNDSLAPMQMFGIGLMAVGTALLIVSVVYKRRQSSVG